MLHTISHGEAHTPLMEQKLAIVLAGDLAKNFDRRLSIKADDVRIQLERHREGGRLWNELIVSAEVAAGLISRNGNIGVSFREDNVDEFTIFVTATPEASMHVTHNPKTQEVRWPKCEGFPDFAEVLAESENETRYHTASVAITGSDLGSLIFKAFVMNP